MNNKTDEKQKIWKNTYEKWNKNQINKWNDEYIDEWIQVKCW